MSEKLIQLKVITPTRMFFEGEVKSFIVKTRGEVGEFAILPDHAPLTASVGLGTLVLNLPDGSEKTTSLFGGYAVVQNNDAVIIAESAEWPEEIDLERATHSKERAEERLKEQEEIDVDRARASLIRALVRLNLGNRIKK